MNSGPADNRPLAWVTGAGGLIGHYLVESAVSSAPGWKVLGLTRADFDLTDSAATERRFTQDQPALVIHCAALSRSGDCEANPTLAWKTNVEATTRLAQLAARARFIFFSSDMVFDGEQGHYDESAPMNPLSVYGKTKAAAERELSGHPGALIIRTSLNGGASPTADRGFNEQLRREWQAGRTTTLFTDEYRSPIAAEVTARAVWDLAQRASPGIYHVAGSERLSRWDLGRLIAGRWPQLNPQIRPGSLKEYRGPKRPADVSLHCGKAQELLAAPLPRFSDWLRSRPDVLF